MAFTTRDDVMSYYINLSLKDSEGNDNDITEADVDRWIDEETIIIKLTIGKKYLLPITNTDDLTYLKLINEKLVVCKIDRIIRAATTDEEKEMMRRRDACKEAQEMLKKILSGEILLNADQKSFRAFNYNKTTVYDEDCDCRQIEKECEDE